MTSTKSKDLALAGALIALAGAVYVRALGIGFYSDDWQWLGRMNATLDHPSYVFTVFYRDFNPVLHASFVVDWIAGGGRAWSFHLQSLALHLATTVLLFLLCRRLTGQAVLAFAAALVFALNVRLSEVVLWPAARGHELATLFTLGAVLVAGSRWRWRGASAALLFVAALLSKETAIVMLPVFPLLMPDWRRMRGALVAMAAAAAAFAAFKLFATPSFGATAAPIGDVVRKVPFLLLRPLGLGDWYSFGWPECLAVLAIFGGAFWLARRSIALAGLAWVAAGTVPIIPLEKLSSRYLYLPTVGWSIVLCGAVAWIVAKLPSAAARRTAAIAGVAALALVAAGNALDVQREIGDYADLAAPYDALAAALAPSLATVPPGGNVVVFDAGPRDTISRLAASLAERGTITKLIPVRPDAVEGLICVQDLINGATPRRKGSIARSIPLDEADEPQWIVWDGRAARTLAGRPVPAPPPERTFAAKR